MGYWTGNMGATAGEGLVFEGNIQSDAKYVEVTLGGGGGVAAEVYLMPITVVSTSV